MSVLKDLLISIVLFITPLGITVGYLKFTRYFDVYIYLDLNEDLCIAKYKNIRWIKGRSE